VVVGRDPARATAAAVSMTIGAIGLVCLMGRQDPTAPFQSGDAVLALADDRFDSRALAPSAAPGTGRDRRALDSATRIR
jgi:hypothetical protein